MCLAIPVRIESIENDDTAMADIGGLRKAINISLKEDPMNIFETNVPFLHNTLFAKNIASLHNSPVEIESIFFIPVVFSAISESTTSTLVLK